MFLSIRCVRRSGKGSEILRLLFEPVGTRGAEAEVGRKQEKAQQRKKYQEAFKKVKHGHGGRPIKKREEAALGR